MGRINITAFKAAPDEDTDLIQVIDDRLPLLRRLGLATDRAEVRCQSRDGVVITISIWPSQGAIDRAHKTPEMLALRRRFAAYREWLGLNHITGRREDFATITAIG